MLNHNNYSNRFKDKFDNARALFTKLIFLLEELVLAASDTVYKEGKESGFLFFEHT